MTLIVGIFQILNVGELRQQIYRFKPELFLALFTLFIGILRIRKEPNRLRIVFFIVHEMTLTTWMVIIIIISVCMYVFVVMQDDAASIMIIIILCIAMYFRLCLFDVFSHRLKHLIIFNITFPNFIFKAKPFHNQLGVTFWNVLCHVEVVKEKTFQ